jgi:mgtE-like transporter
MLGRLVRPWRPLRGLLGPDAVGARQSLIALAASSVASIGAGVALSAISDTLVDLPGLLVLAPAATGIRGNIFGTLGSRLSTSIHTGTFRLSRRVDSVVGQNVAAALVLTLATALFLAVVARLTAVAFHVPSVISVSDFVVVSMLGGVGASLVVLGVSLALAESSARRGWDLDNVNAPIVSAVGDLVTLPALFLATAFVSLPVLTPVLALMMAVVAVTLLVVGLRSGMRLMVEILKESMPILALAGTISAVAGVVLELRLQDFAALPALLILVPATLSGAGAVGGILSGQFSTKLHLGVIRPGRWPDRQARGDLRVALGIALPVFLLNGVLAAGAAELLDRPGPGTMRMVLISLVGGMLATAFVAAVAFYGTMSAVRLGVDPDTYGIPIVSSSVDLVGAYTLVLAITLLTAA